jgi:hypothetical protein
MNLTPISGFQSVQDNTTNSPPGAIDFYNCKERMVWTKKIVKTIDPLLISLSIPRY